MWKDFKYKRKTEEEELFVLTIWLCSAVTDKLSTTRWVLYVSLCRACPQLDECCMSAVYAARIHNSMSVVCQFMQSVSTTRRVLYVSLCRAYPQFDECCMSAVMPRVSTSRWVLYASLCKAAYITISHVAYITIICLHYCVLGIKCCPCYVLSLCTIVTNIARAAHQHRQAFQLLLVLLPLHAGNETACVTCQSLPPVQIIIRGENSRCVFLIPDSAATSASAACEQDEIQQW